MKKHYRPYDEYRNTTNRYVFNRVHKHILEKERKICCSWCSYHYGENSHNKYYGETYCWDNNKKIHYPNWKLVSKKRKQWMEGTYRKKIEVHVFLGESVKFEF